MEIKKCDIGWILVIVAMAIQAVYSAGIQNSRIEELRDDYDHLIEYVWYSAGNVGPLLTRER